MNDIKVSICCQTYNHVNYIEECLNGFLMQKTNFKFEILLRDDASADGTTEIVKKYSDKYPDIINPLIYNENQYQKGVSPFRDNVKRAKGKYIAICEGDDYWTDSYKLQKQVDLLEMNSIYGLVYSDIDTVDENNSYLSRKFITQNELAFCNNFEEFLIYAPFIAPCTWLFRKEFISYEKKNFVVGDLPLLLDISSRSKVYMIKEVTSNYRISKNSASHHTDPINNYNFNKGILDIQLYYATKYKVSSNVLFKIFIKNFKSNYLNALKFNDYDFIKLLNGLINRANGFPFYYNVLVFTFKHKVIFYLIQIIFNFLFLINKLIKNKKKLKVLWFKNILLT
ncbi:glycosyltransferase [Flavobacterium sp.]|uniref:glycosyltransferase n=1 Tax=Flavobacterium sp. TaxID=239 RepID=UPI001B6D0CCD|nr:glycosyltransferase [Flavobacterium sp.]MBP6182581.1 glycosyltransferase [Flavobacterium sp.]